MPHTANPAATSRTMKRLRREYSMTFSIMAHLLWSAVTPSALFEAGNHPAGIGLFQLALYLVPRLEAGKQFRVLDLEGHPFHRPHLAGDGLVVECHFLFGLVHRHYFATDVVLV